MNNNAASNFAAHFYRSTRTPSVVLSVCIRGEFANLEAAQAFAATLPKSLKAEAYELHDGFGTRARPLVAISAKIAADGINGGKNETGIKRLRTALSLLNVTNAAEVIALL